MVFQCPQDLTPLKRLTGAAVSKENQAQPWAHTCQRHESYGLTLRKQDHKVKWLLGNFLPPHSICVLPLPPPFGPFPTLLSACPAPSGISPVTEFPETVLNWPWHASWGLSPLLNHHLSYVVRLSSRCNTLNLTPSGSTREVLFYGARTC